MATERFRRRLDEALAAIGGGIDAPVDIGADDGSDEPFEPDPRKIKALYEWVKAAPAKILLPVIETLEQVDPTLDVTSIELARKAGYGSSSYSGTASITGTWRIAEDDPRLGPLESAIRHSLLRSDLWKFIQVEYRDAYQYLDSDAVMTHLLRALAFKLGDMNHAAYWMHLLKGPATERATAALQTYIARHSGTLIEDPSELEGAGVRAVPNPGTLKVYPAKQAANIMKGSTPISRLAGNGGFRHAAGFEMAARLAFTFTGSVRFEREGAEPGGQYILKHIAAGLKEALDQAWESLSDELEVTLYPPYFDDNDWYPEQYTITLPEWQDLFDEDLESEQIAAVLENLPPEVLHLARTRVNCTRNAREADDYSVDVTATLALKSARLGPDGLNISLAVTAVDVS